MKGSLEEEIAEKDTQLIICKDMLIDALNKLTRKYEERLEDTPLAKISQNQGGKSQLIEGRSIDQENMLLRELVAQQNDKIRVMGSKLTHKKSMSGNNACRTISAPFPPPQASKYGAKVQMLLESPNQCASWWVIQ